MATIKFSIKSKKNFAPIYVRMQHSKLFDFEKPLTIYVEPKNFDSKNQRIRRVMEVPNSEELNQSLNNLRNYLFTKFNDGMITGQDFNRNWFNNCVNNFFGLKFEDKLNLHKLFISDYCDYWLKEVAPTYRISADKYITGNSLKNYQMFLTIFKKFQCKTKIKFSELDQSKFDEFANFLIQKEVYGHEHARRLIQRLQFFCKQAEQMQIEVNQDYKKRIFLSKETKKDCVDPYFNETEIQALFDLKFEPGDILEDMRDNLIISVWTGLRVSDFLRLKLENIQDGYIELKSTQKTGIGVMIPIHPQVQEILNKRNGNLPRSISEQKYNIHIKKIAELAGITNTIYGSLVKIIKDSNGSEVSRKVLGNYPKCKLVSSHIGRRSFATNLFGKVPNSVIMACAGWKSEDMMLRYIKKTRNDHVEILAKFWETQETKSNILKVVNE